MGFNNGRSTALVGLPITVAGIIYIVFRHKSLILFDWLQQLHLMPVVADLRAITVPMGEALPDWVLFSLPDGLWLLSYLLFVRMVWADGPKRPMWAWAGLGLLVSVGHEVSQAAGLVSGTFDWADMAAYTAATIVAFGPRWVHSQP
jgi:hypothetical protein